MIINWAAVGASVLPNLGGWANGYATKKEITTWYPTLNKPSWTPPDRAFGPVWTCLYTGMGYASYLVWRDCGRQFGGKAALPLGLYASQLALNWSWTPIFFGAHNLKLSLVNIVLLTGNVAACGYSFYQVNETAGLIMIPYLVWLALATALNYRIYMDNPKQIKDKPSKKIK